MIALFVVSTGNPAQTSLLAKTQDYITNAYLMPRLDYVMFYCVHRNSSVCLTRQLLWFPNRYCNIEFVF